MHITVTFIIVTLFCLVSLGIGFSFWEVGYLEPMLVKLTPAKAEIILGQIRMLNLIRLGVESILVVLMSILLIRFLVLRPLKSMADWMKKTRLGEWSRPQGVNLSNAFQGLFKEIARTGFNLHEAKGVAEKEARLRHKAESVWTPERLKEFVKSKIEDRPICVVSNRQPYEHQWDGKEMKCVVPASGLVTAIEPVLKACGGTWIAQGTGAADRRAVDTNDKLKVPPDDPQYFLRRIWVSKEENDGFYLGFSNEGIWPLCHIAHTRPIFRIKDWDHYENVNERFANAVLEEIKDAKDPYVMIQDYHFALLPKLIKDKRPDARVAIFWHIPWPNPESFGICPWKNQILKGILGADIIGFHTQYHCNNFLDTVGRFLECRIDYENFNVNREGNTAWVKPFPISIAFLGGSDSGRDPADDELDREALLEPYRLDADFLAVGVDRIDYTKGILERLLSVEHFLEKNPAYQGRFTYVELGAPSRTDIATYKELSDDIRREADRINARFRERSRDERWKPILILEKYHSRSVIMSFYRSADICMVTSLHDGMNLVAKEFVMARNDEKGVLILSEFTGAAMELGDALIINPYDIAGTAAAIKKGIEMPGEEQTRRMHHMREVLKDRNIYRWAADLVDELARVRIGAQNPDKVLV